MRIVGGRLRGRALAAPKTQAIRPTADRLRESLFNILAHAYGDPVTGARVLDLFAGTGALGFEAISRGATFVQFIDDGAEARALLRQNIEALGLAAITKIFRRDATKLGPLHPAAPYSLVFLDPPYGKGLAERGARVCARGRLAGEGCADCGRGERRGGIQSAGRIRGAGAAQLRRHGVCDLARLNAAANVEGRLEVPTPHPSEFVEMFE